MHREHPQNDSGVLFCTSGVVGDRKGGMRKSAKTRIPTEIETVSPAAVTLDPLNARAHPTRNLSAIRQSLLQFGQTKPIVLSRDGIVLAGNGTVLAARELGWDTLAAVRVPLDGEQARAYAIADNRAAELAEWDYEALAGLMKDLDHRDLIGWSSEEIDDVLGALVTDEEEDGEDDPAEPTVDPVWPGEPDFDIPLLRLDRQAQTIEHPVVRWGALKRKTKVNGTYHFYTDDRKFGTLFDEPTQLLLSGCPIAVEPNYTVISTTPRAVALWAIYRKRWLARLWQQHGVLIVVDLNLGAHEDIALLGVPPGWGAYSTRCHADGEDSIERIKRHHAMAVERCGAKPHLFAVFGGGKRAKNLCSQEGWTWIMEDAQAHR